MRLKKDERYLFIGGPLSGQRRVIGGQWHDAAFYEGPSPCAGPVSSEELTVKKVRYIRQCWYGNKTEFIVWTPEDQTTDQTMDLLLTTFEKANDKNR